jgi:hypothetical protein
MSSGEAKFNEHVFRDAIFPESFIRVGGLVRTTFFVGYKIAGKTGFFDFCIFYNSTKEHSTREIF